MPESWAILFKFGKKHHLEKLRSDGLLYMNPIRNFADHEKSLSPSQTDKFEGVEEIVQPRDLKSLTVGTGVEQVVLGPESFVGPIRWSLGRTPAPNVYCMFALSDPWKAPLVDSRNFDFGDSFIMFTHTDEFIGRVQAIASERHCDLQWSPVEYFDENEYSGKTGPFKKPSAFSYQNEFRFALHPGSNEAVKLSVGDLTDISTKVFPLNQVNQLIKIESND